jgi:Flp pilus assembly protein TadB
MESKYARALLLVLLAAFVAIFLYDLLANGTVRVLSLVQIALVLAVLVWLRRTERRGRPGA